MHLTTLGSDIILSHVLPLLSQEDVFSLSAVDMQMMSQVGHLRFKKTKVSKSQGFIIDYLQPSTLDTIQDLTLNGDDVGSNLVFKSDYFKLVASATLVTPITTGQRANFSLFVTRLSHLTESINDENEDEDVDAVTSLSPLAEGSLRRLHTLTLELTLPQTLGNLLNISPYLRKITHLPETNSEDLTGYQKYASTLKSLFELCADASVLPALRLVHIHPGDGDKLTHRPMRAQILEGMWRAAANHGGWRLFADKPDGSRRVQYPDAHEILWSHKQWEFSISLAEFEGFKTCCAALGIYPHLDRFIAGKVNIRIIGVAPVRGALVGACVDGLNIEQDDDTNLQDVFQVMNRNTNAVTIKLNETWGLVSSTSYSPDRFMHVKAMRIQGPDTPETGATRHYNKNVVAGLVSSLSVKDWQNLVNLSLPVQAFQILPLVEEGSAVPNFAACGVDVGGYDLAWLSSCKSLQAMQFTGWDACPRCDLSDEVSLVGGFRHLPPSVVFVLVSGHYRCQARRSMHWRTVVKGSITSALLAQRADMVVSLRRLRVGIF